MVYVVQAQAYFQNHVLRRLGDCFWAEFMRGSSMYKTGGALEARKAVKRTAGVQSVSGLPEAFSPLLQPIAPPAYQKRVT